MSNNSKINIFIISGSVILLIIILNYTKKEKYSMYLNSIVSDSIKTSDDALKYLCTKNQTFVLNNRELCLSL